MSQKRRSPHRAGNGHKLAGWVREQYTAVVAWWPITLPVLVVLGLWWGTR